MLNGHTMKRNNFSWNSKGIVFSYGPLNDQMYISFLVFKVDQQYGYCINSNLANETSHHKAAGGQMTTDHQPQ